MDFMRTIPGPGFEVIVLKANALSDEPGIRTLTLRCAMEDGTFVASEIEG